MAQTAMGTCPPINFVDLRKKSLNGYTLIEGFPGMGLIGTISAKYVIERLKAEQIGYIDSEIFMPIIRIHNGVPLWPARIYVSEKNKIVILLSEQIIPQYATDCLAKAVVSWIQQKGIKKAISLAGISLGENERASSKIYGIAANEKSKPLLKKAGVEIIQDGITTGVTALILLGLKNTNTEAFSILGNVTMQADYKGAAELIKKLAEILGLTIDIAPLMKEAQETEKELLKHITEIKKTQETVQKFEKKTPMYT